LRPLGWRDGNIRLDPIRPTARVGWLGSRSLNPVGIAGATIGGGVIVVVGACLTWFSLFAGLQPYRGLDVLNGRLLAIGGVVGILAGVRFALRDGPRLRWGIGLWGFVLLAFASWSVLQLRIIYRALAADPFVVARLGSGLTVVVAGALLIFATLFLNEG
jgi:hypothetical protein